MGRLIRWLKRLLGFGKTDEDDEPDFSQYPLQDIGDAMCRSHDSVGDIRRPGGRNVHFGEYSMGVVLERAFGGADLRPYHVRQLDWLLEQAKRNDSVLDARQEQKLEQHKVEQFRREFFDLFTEEEIARVLREMYQDSAERFKLLELVGEETTSGYAFNYHVTDPEPAQVRMEGETMPMSTTEIREKSVEMKNLGGQFDLGKSNVGATIDEVVDTQAEMLWDQIDVNYGTEHDESYPRWIVESMQKIQEQMGRPDTIVLDGEDAPDDVQAELTDVVWDDTGVMDVPFVVADTNHLGYRVTAEGLTAERPDPVMEPYLYRMHWAGNFAIVDQDMITGPV